MIASRISRWVWTYRSAGWIRRRTAGIADAESKRQDRTARSMATECGGGVVERVATGWVTGGPQLVGSLVGSLQGDDPQVPRRGHVAAQDRRWPSKVPEYRL